jgi:hypothetical protein
MSEERKVMPPCIDASVGETEPKTLKAGDDYICQSRGKECKYRIYFVTLPLCQYHKPVDGLTSIIDKAI